MRSNPTQQQQAIYRQYLKRFFYSNTQCIYAIPHTRSAEILSGLGINRAQKAMYTYISIADIEELAVSIIRPLQKLTVKKKQKNEQN